MVDYKAKRRVKKRRHILSRKYEIRSFLLDHYQKKIFYIFPKKKLNKTQ
jgi:hypothetical protein